MNTWSKPQHKILSLFVLILILPLLESTALAAKVFIRPNESDKNFIERVTNHKLTGDGNGRFQIARTSKLLKGSEVLVAFTEVLFEDTEPSNGFEIYLNFFIKDSPLQYESPATFVACEVEGGSPALRTFFYVDLKSETTPVIAVICSWPKHAGADCNLSDEVKFFKLTSKSISPVPMANYKELFYYKKKPEPKSDFTCSYARFKTAKDVKTLLLKSR